MTATTTKISALQTKLAAAVALVANLEAQIKAADLPLPVKGDSVAFTFGRGEKKVEYTGRVIATNEGDNGVSYVSVLVNEDSLPEIKRVPAKDVTLTSVSLTVPEQAEVNSALDAAAVVATVPVVELDAHAAAVAELLGE